MLELMLFMFLFLLAFIVMFIYLLKKIDNNFKQLSEDHAQLRVLVRAMESHLEHLRQKQTAAGEKKNPEIPLDGTNDNTGYDPLLMLSFEERPTPDQELPNPALELNMPKMEK